MSLNPHHTRWSSTQKRWLFWDYELIMNSLFPTLIWIVKVPQNSDRTAGKLVTKEHSSNSGWEREVCHRNSYKTWSPLTLGLLSVGCGGAGVGPQSPVIAVLYVYTCYKNNASHFEHRQIDHLQNQPLSFFDILWSPVCFFLQVAVLSIRWVFFRVCHLYGNLTYTRKYIDLFKCQLYKTPNSLCREGK